MIWLFTLSCQEKQEDTSVVVQQEDTAQEASVENTYETTILQLIEGTPVQEKLLEGVDGAWFHDGMIFAQQKLRQGR